MSLIDTENISMSLIDTENISIEEDGEENILKGRENISNSRRRRILETNAKENRKISNVPSAIKEKTLSQNIDELNTNAKLEHIRFNKRELTNVLELENMTIRRVFDIIGLLTSKNCVLESTNYYICIWFLLILFVEVSLVTSIDDEMDWHNIKSIQCLESICKRFDPSERYKPKPMPIKCLDKLTNTCSSFYTLREIAKDKLISRLYAEYPQLAKSENMPWLVWILYYDQNVSKYDDICKKRYEYESIRIGQVDIEAIMWYFCIRLGNEGVTYMCQYLDSTDKYKNRNQEK